MADPSPATLSPANLRASGSGELRVHQAKRLRGILRLPGDKSITHRALILAALAEGRSEILGGSDGLDCNSTAACLQALGVQVERRGEAEGGRVDRLVTSPGREGWRAPAGSLDCGNSGTTLRLLAGALAGCPFEVTLDGDASLRRRPVARIIEPLRSMGASLRARSDDTLPPLTLTGRFPLRPIDHTPPVPSAQVKSAVLLAGLAADGRTTVHEAVVTRDHTERMLRARGVAVASGREPVGAGSWVSVEGPAPVRSTDERIPGDVSAAAFWLVAGAAHPDAELSIDEVGLNPTRRAAIDLLRAMGARIDEEPLGDAGGEPADGEGEGGEPVGRLTVRSSELSALEMGPAEVAAAIDEIPVLALAAACASGTSVFRGVGELRHKESDRVAGIAAGLKALGASVEIRGDELRITGGAGRPGFGLRGAPVSAQDDHRLAMTFAVAGLLAQGESHIEGAASAAVSDPAFFEQLARLPS
jgi:3-phosphoshikimate 1-carboxyvinyltransferase